MPEHSSLINPFEPEMVAYDRATAEQRFPTRPVVFYGSSSIRLWTTLSEDFPGVPVVNRGFGGSTLQQCVQFLPRLVWPLNPRAIVLYAGDNDLAEAGRTPEDVRESLREFISSVRGRFGDIPVTYLSIKPSPSRLHLLDKIRTANRLCREWLADQRLCMYVDVFTPMLGSDGRPRLELFDSDHLHLSREGYRLWRRCLRPGADPMVSEYGPLARPEEKSIMNREYHKWYSHRLGRDMELLVFGHAGARVVVFPTRAHRFHEYEDAGMVGALRHKIEAGWLQLFCVDSIDEESLYCFWKHPADRIRRHVQYEDYILSEVLPFTAARNPNPFLISHGCSLGAFHAANIAFRHPHRFGRLVAFSGRYDLARHIEDFRDLFDGYFDDQIYHNCPSRFLPNLHDPGILSHLRNLSVIMTVGEEDPFRPDNHHVINTLNAKGVRTELYIWGGRAHRYRDWRQMAPLYL